METEPDAPRAKAFIMISRTAVATDKVVIRRVVSWAASRGEADISSPLSPKTAPAPMAAAEAGR
ncbi:hypothetical protein D3C73_1254630 [compost metagenome]